VNTKGRRAAMSAFLHPSRPVELIQLLPMCFLLSKSSYGSPTHNPDKKNKKTAAINTAPTHRAIIYAASAFGFFICLR